MNIKKLLLLAVGLRGLIVICGILVVGAHYMFSAISPIPERQINPPIWFENAATLDEIQAALNEGKYDINAYYMGRTGLMQAIALPGDRGLGIATLLLMYGADPNLRENKPEEGAPALSLDPGSQTVDLGLSGNTALHIAAFMGNLTDAPERIALLLRYGADPNIGNGLDDTALQALRDVSPTNLWEISEDNSDNFQDMIRMLVDNGVDINHRDKFGLDFLDMMAAERNAFTTVRTLIRDYGSILDFTSLDNRGKTVEQLAFDLGWRDMADMIHAEREILDVRGKLGQNNIDDRDYFKRTGLMLAMMGDRFVFGSNILGNNAGINAAAVNAEDRAGNRPLHYAVLNRRESAAYTKLLLDNKAEVNVANITNRDTPLHLAVTIADPGQRRDVIKQLLEKGADRSAQNKQGNTPLHIAVLRNYVDAIKLLKDQTSKGIVNYGLAELYDAKKHPDLQVGADIGVGLNPRDLALRLKHLDAAAALSE